MASVIAGVNLSDRKLKPLLFLPVIVVPFVALLFYSFGGGKLHTGETQSTSSGLNFNLPNADFQDEKPSDKMSLYAQQEQDSSNLNVAREYDPYYKSGEGDTGKPNGGVEAPFSATASDENSTTESKIRGRLDELSKRVADESNVPGKMRADESTASVDSRSIKALEEAMATLQTQSSPVDPELSALNGMLDKVLDIQNPSRIKERARQLSMQKQDHAVPLKVDPNSGFTDLFPSKHDTAHIKSVRRRAFLDISPSEEQRIDNAIPATVHSTATIVTGSTLKLRLDVDLYINGIQIPRGTFVYGVASISGERLQLTITQIKYGDNLFPVSLKMYNTDGIEGIPVPGSITRDIAKTDADNALQSLQLASLDPSITSQAASAGIQSIKTIIGRKTKLIRVTIKADHPVLLKDSN
ncbi:conjugative transposon protein TraM [Chitinophaga varians]|uniref:Conjugative transposon protein TraM n=1 Tax=Chitinophaga varians TaxID=2202339 RepID=A0A847S0Q0_9BACT|nr:conjugative transposon protein TraM [Chitinophaga varians]NLR67914.1 conjugative transposon protein TraM [Chitinophaga varians]